MCYILAYNVKSEKDKKFILETLKEKWRLNNNGISGVFNGSNSLRSMFFSDNLIKQKIDKSNSGAFHLRLATSGSVDESNLHFWRFGDYFFAHNGYVMGLNSNTKADSLLFLERIFSDNKDNVIKKIKNGISKYRFSGRLIGINKDEAILFGDWFIYYTKTGGVLISSSSLNKYLSKYIFLGDVSIEIKDEKFIIGEEKIDGIYRFVFKKNVFEYIDEIKRFNYLNDYYRSLGFRV